MAERGGFSSGEPPCCESWRANRGRSPTANSRPEPARIFRRLLRCAAKRHDPAPPPPGAKGGSYSRSESALIRRRVPRRRRLLSLLRWLPSNPRWSFSRRRHPHAGHYNRLDLFAARFPTPFRSQIAGNQRLLTPFHFCQFPFTYVLRPLARRFSPFKHFELPESCFLDENVILGRESGMFKHDPNSAQPATDAEMRRGVGSGFALASA